LVHHKVATLTEALEASIRMEASPVGEENVGMTQV